MTSPGAPDQPRPAQQGGWGRVRAAHFHDYNAPAFAAWLLIVVCGAAALAWSLSGARIHSAAHTDTLLALLLVAVAAWFPIEIPRSKYSMGAADMFIFVVLAVLGTPAAVLAAGVEGAVGAARSTRRLTSRVSTPCAAMAAMAVTGALFDALCAQLTTLGLGDALAKLAALPIVALLPLTLTSLSLMTTVTLKRGQWPNARDWLQASSWMASVYAGSALLAGMVQLGAVGHGSIAVGIIAVATLLVVLLVRQSIARNEIEHREQEARIRDAQQEAQVNHERFVAAFAHAAIGMAIVEPAGRIERANLALCDLLRRREEQLLGSRFVDVLHPDDLPLFERQLGAMTHDGGPNFSIELRCRAGDDSDVWIALHCGRFNDPSCAAGGVIYQLHDITSRQLAERRLQHIAYHDSLTDLANRACFHEKLAAAVEASRVDPAEQFAVVFLDIDRFKIVNDSLGHFAGNELLREVGHRLQRDLRQNDLVARLGGDEFAILLRGLRDSASTVARVERMLHELAAPMTIRGHEVLPRASAGITFSDLGYRTVDELLRDADLAMYEAKAGRRGGFAVFDRTMHERIADKLALESDLRRAIGEGRLSLSFQPVYELAPYRLIGFEALARWTHPTRGVVSPAVFIALAEEAGHIDALTRWALNKAIEQLAAWHAQAPHVAHAGIHVNISARDLTQPRFPEFVVGVLARHGVSPGMLTLEITETVLMSEIGLASDTLSRLHAAGIRLAIDDFGTGYSSLAYLSKLPIDCLKIDRSFVIAMQHSEGGVEIVRAVLNVGQALGKRVVAEGIETPEQVATLRQLGVHAGQGYLLSRPLPAEQVTDLLYAPGLLASASSSEPTWR